MSYTDTKNKIDAIRSKIEQFGILSEEQKKKINYKFRLEWNYNSNSMEGNTLTIEETRSVMTGNLTVNEKPLKDVLEMKGHDEVITEILKIGKGELRLSEKRIRDIHHAIMHEDNEAERDKIGKWKEKANMIYNHKGEKYDFVKPEEVPQKMHALLDRTNAGIDAIKAGKKNAPHPLDIALQFHLDYLDIHPFYDGNGRTARILTNLILISLGYTPFWITEKERKIYYQYISDIQGYGGSNEFFYDYVGNLVLRSQQLVSDAIEGKDISDEDDLDKEIELFKKQLVKKDKLVSRNNSDVAKLYRNSIEPLFRSLLDKLSKFDDLFDKKTVTNIFDFKQSDSLDDDLEDFTEFFSRVIYMSNLSDKVNTGEHTEEEFLELRMLELQKIKEVHSIALSVNYRGFKNNDTNTFGARSELCVFFNDYSFKINSHGQNHDEGNFVKKLYTEVLTKEEIDSIVKKSVSDFLNKIKSSIENK